MVTDILQLVGLCKEEISSREYNLGYSGILVAEWEKVSFWMAENGFNEFSESIGYRYCDENFGNHILAEGVSKTERVKIRAVRMLTSYQKDGDFEFRTPSVEKVFSNLLGEQINGYLEHLDADCHFAAKTIDNKRYYLFDFYRYLTTRSIPLEYLSTYIIEEYFMFMGYTPASRRNCGTNLKMFLRYAHDSGITSKDYSIYVMDDNYDRHSKIPTTYTEDEIRRTLSVVERSSATGRRDYLILLLAAEYGWRAKDIVEFRLSQIDWDRNVISLRQNKTGAMVEFPLLASVGNAVIDYLRNGRHQTDTDVVILSSESGKKGRPLSCPTIHSVVSKYLGRASVPDYQTKKHGPHAFRHSLATNMLGRNISIPIISTILGHQSTEATKVYLSIDVEKLRQCPVPMPPLHSSHYKEVRV